MTLPQYKHSTGDGDPCAQDRNHGRMWLVASGRQWCPSSNHRGSQFYENDGVTPWPVAPTGAVESVPLTMPIPGGRSTATAGAPAAPRSGS